MMRVAREIATQRKTRQLGKAAPRFGIAARATVIEPDSPATRCMEQITRAAERGRALSTRLAELARAREPKRSVVDMAEIAREIVSWLRVARPDLHIELSCDDVATTVVGDPVQLHQVVMNLTQNGVEALSDRAGLARRGAEAGGLDDKSR